MEKCIDSVRANLKNRGTQRNRGRERDSYRHSKDRHSCALGKRVIGKYKEKDRW